ncbi:MAG TPA: hypothetical protein VHL30_03215, partial [Chlamydiales bacterium]|nr:hypothetical protein [Chlamydiales bacterium]
MGNRLLRCLVLFSLPLFADSPPDFSLASVYNEPSVFVEGKVNAITGELVDFEEDVVIQGAEPIYIHRTYLNSTRKDWIFLPHANPIIDLSEDHQNCTIRESTGCPIHYKQVSKTNKRKKTLYRYEPIGLEEGFSNIASCGSLKNNYAIYEEEKRQLTLHTAEGIERLYEKRRKNEVGIGEPWRLLSEHLPNGNWLLYDYIKTNEKYSGPIYALSSIRSTNPSQIKQYAEARFLHEDPKGKNKHFFIEGSDGQRLEYRFDVQNGRQSGYLNAVLSDARRADQFYEHCKHHDQTDYWHFEPKERMIGAIGYPGNRRLEVSYYFRQQEKVDGTKVVLNEKAPLSGNIVDFIPDKRRGRVKMLSAPRGVNNQMVVAHTFFYDIENKKTIVYDADKNRNEYFYDEQSRIQRLERYDKSGLLLNVELFEWANCNLVSKTLLDQNQKPIHTKKFSYDARSNLKQETSIGNLSGKGEETYSKEWRYSEGTPSLLLELKTEDGLRITYDYLSGTNLPVRKLTFADGKIAARQFWVYNEDSLLIREIIDDGNGQELDNTTAVAVRTIRDYRLRTEQPYLGMPEIIEEKYWDGASELLLQKTVLHYTKAGLIVRRDIYDSNDVFRYSLHTEYDSKGRPKSESNPAGWIAYSQFDEVGNQTYARDFSGRTETVCSYDAANRLREKNIKGFDGLVQTSHYQYNVLNFLTSQIDPQGNATKYMPNPFGRSTETWLPPILNEFGIAVSPILHADYDAAGNAIQRIDAENFATKISYNAYGFPVEIIHPDQSKETYEYFKNGLLKSHTDQIGVLTSYERDPFGQISRKSISQSGKILAEEFFQYKGERLIRKTDAEGHQTHYIYDGAGRKIREEFEGEETLFQYDELGRNHIVEKGTVRTALQFDLLDRVLEKREEEIATGQWLRKTVTHYDTANNPVEIYNWVGVENQQCCEKLEYDSLNRLISRIDPLGNKETVSYNEVFSVGQNLKVLQKTHRNALGLETIEQLDTHARVASIEKRKGDQLLFKEQKIYNRRGLLSLQTNTIFNPDRTSRKVPIKWEYDSTGRLFKLIEPNSKVTTYTYTPRGELKTVAKPNGCLLSYDYSGLGDLELIFSSDGTVRHQMHYNKLGALLWSDGNKLAVDSSGRILSEDFANGLRIENTYNNSGQRNTCRIPSADCLIEYAYRGNDMSEVSRKTLSGIALYTHRYLQ